MADYSAILGDVDMRRLQAQEERARKDHWE